MFLFCSHCDRNVLVGTSGECPSCKRSDGLAASSTEPASNTTAGSTVVCYNTRTANTIGIAQIVILLCGFGTLAVILVRRQLNSPATWLCLGFAAFFGLLLANLIRSRYSTTPRLTLDESGITLHPSGITLLWRDFRKVSERKHKFHRFLEVELRDIDSYSAKLTGFRRLLRTIDGAFGQKTFSIPISATTVDADVIRKVVFQRSEAYVQST